MADFFDPSSVTLRPSGRIMGTNYGNELRNAIVRSKPAPLTGNTDGPLNANGYPLRWMKVSTASDSNNIAVCHYWDGTTAGTANIPVLTTPGLVAGQTLYASQVAPNTGITYSGKPVTWLQITNGRGHVFPVGLTKDGGSNGVNGSSKCTFTYTCKSIHGDTLATAVALTGWGNGWSFLKLALSEATVGQAYIDGSGTLVLIHVDEHPLDEVDCA